MSKGICQRTHMSGNHIYTSEFRTLCRELEKKGCPALHVGREAMKRLGVERAVKKRYHDEYLERKLAQR